MSELKDFPYLSSDELNQAQCALFTLCYILQNDQSRVTHE